MRDRSLTDGRSTAEDQEARKADGQTASLDSTEAQTFLEDDRGVSDSDAGATNLLKELAWADQGEHNESTCTRDGHT